MDSDHVELDVAVIGAGIAGLSAAKTYLQCAPDTKLAIYDNNATIGGVWSKERLYPDLKTNNQLGSFEMPGFPMHAGYGVKPGEHIPGAVVHRYVCDYAAHHGLTELVHLRSKVVSAEKLGEAGELNRGWQLQVQQKTSADSEQERKFTVVCKKLIVSTGFTSQEIPRSKIKGEETFDRPIMTSTTIARDASENIHSDAPEQERQITVLGASKSSYDFVWMFVSRGYRVNWVIRKSGAGAAPLLPPRIRIGPFFPRMEDLIMSRAIGWLGPSIWEPRVTFSFKRILANVLHRTRIGRAVIKHMWANMRASMLEQTIGRTTAPAVDHENGVHNLIPDHNIVWYGTRTGMLNYPFRENGRGAIHEFIRSGQIKVYREDLSHLSAGAVHLADSNNTILPSPGGLAIATRWSTAPNLIFPQTELHADLGIPSPHFSEDQKAFWHDLDTRATAQILEHLPWLREAPLPPVQQPGNAVGLQSAARAEPFRLHRFLAPPVLTAKGDRSIVFHGYVSNVANTLKLEVCSLWCYAYLNGTLSFADDASTFPAVASDNNSSASSLVGTANFKDNNFISTTSTPRDSQLVASSSVLYQAALFNAYARLRVPCGYGSKLADFEFEQLPYFDVLMRDLGLNPRRKSWLLADYFTPYGPDEYRGIVDEWLAKQGKQPRQQQQQRPKSD